MQAWENCSLHKTNLLTSEHVCGAIATYNGMWFAIFYDKDKSEIDNWKQYNLKPILVKRYDSTTGSAISGSNIGFYDVENRDSTLQMRNITDVGGTRIFLEVGKTYLIYERKRPDGYEKAESVTITVTEDGASEVVLTSGPSTN